MIIIYLSREVRSPNQSRSIRLTEIKEREGQKKYHGAMESSTHHFLFDNKKLQESKKLEREPTY